ncbi:MAG: HNH endonuclease signature motif containing protein [Gemmatimonadetes bacterium]|nr:HNH endonuclease signature motif containing protein [Gemmatimonadota bacterium]
MSRTGYRIMPRREVERISNETGDNAWRLIRPRRSPGRRKARADYRREYKRLRARVAFKRARLAALERDGQRCGDCGARAGEARRWGDGRRKLHVHHIDTDLERFDDPDNLETLCTRCHWWRHHAVFRVPGVGWCAAKIDDSRIVGGRFTGDVDPPAIEIEPEPPASPPATKPPPWVALAILGAWVAIVAAWCAG